MPTYEYRCRNGHTFELFQRMTDPPPEGCEVCGAPVERILFPVAVHYKGSGFYSTDYGRKAAKRSDAKDSDGASTPPADEGKKPDAKPASKTNET
jgi:putative FmdB family regulatory protein